MENLRGIHSTFVMELKTFIIFSIVFLLVRGIDLDPDVTLNRKIDPSLSDDVQSLPTFRAIFDGKDTQIWNLVNGSHWTIPGEKMNDADLEQYRPTKKP